MLKQISIQNIAIAENVNVEFGTGLNIVTGETGAGKSLLVDALALLRGGRVDTGLIRSHSETAQVSGVFGLKLDSPVYDLLAVHGLPVNEDDPAELVVRRLIQRNGKHRALINDVPVGSKVLQAIAGELIDISSQFENQRLLDTSAHTNYLDAFAGCAELARSHARKFEEMVRLLREIAELEKERDLRRRERSLFEFEAREIAEADLDAGEYTEIEETLALGKKAGAGRTLCAEALELLCESDQSCMPLLKLVRKNFEKLERMTAGLHCSISAHVVDEALASVENLCFEAQKVADAFEIDEEKLSHALERIEIYNKLLSKFGPTLDDVLAHHQRCLEFLGAASDLDARLEHTLAGVKTLVQEIFASAGALSKARAHALKDLSKAVESELAELGMPKARFVCELVPFERNRIEIPTSVTALLTEKDWGEFTKICKSGFEEAHFLLSANSGIDPQAIEKIASGGELSRIMLAIKTVLYANESVSLFVFDEIDTGIGGGVAAKVGRKLSEFCKTRQAICITHLPQVACHARYHFVASKSLKGGRTCTRIRLTDYEERVNELALMLSGETVTPEGVAQARTLLREAKVVESGQLQ